MRWTGTAAEWDRVSLVAVLASLALIGGCNDGRRQAAPPDRPAGRETPDAASQTSEASPATAPTPPADSTPATQPEIAQTQPEGPKSTFSTSPPYPVDLYVRSLDEEQPGWLKIVEMTQDAPVATASGRFPEQNIIQIRTQNVQRLQIEVGYLPLNSKRRIALQIDNQNMELARRDSQFVTLARRPNGAWEVVARAD